MDHAKLLDVLTSLPISQSILPRVVYFATSRPANHAICSFIDSSGYASGPIRRCLFKDYIINQIVRSMNQMYQTVMSLNQMYQAVMSLNQMYQAVMSLNQMYQTVMSLNQMYQAVMSLNQMC